MKKKLTAKQEAFVTEYLKDKNATQAAIRCGYAAGSAQVQGHRLLSNAKISQAVKERLGEHLQEEKISAARVLKELSKGAFHELDLETMKHSDKVKYLEILCKYLGILDGAGASKTNKGDVQKRLLGALTKLGFGRSGDGE